MQVRYDYTRENRLGQKSDNSEMIVVDSEANDLGSDLSTALYSLWAMNLGRLMVYAETIGITLNKITVIGDSTWDTIEDAFLTESFPRQAVRVVITSQMDYDDSREDTYLTRAETGAEAKLNFWAAIKRDGNGFCNTAARVKSLSIVVQKQNTSERVIFDRQPDAQYHEIPTSALPERSRAEYKRVGRFNSPELRAAMAADRRIDYIKRLRAEFSLGLLEAKDIVDYRFNFNRAFFS